MGERNYLKYLQLSRKSEGPVFNSSKSIVFAKLANENNFDHKGRLDLLDIAINPGTATIQFRAIFPNPDLALLPGLFAQVRVPATKGEAMLIPSEAIGRDQDIQFVYVVNNDNVVERRTIDSGQTACGLQVVRAGLRAEEYGYYKRYSESTQLAS